MRPTFSQLSSCRRPQEDHNPHFQHIRQELLLLEYSAGLHMMHAAFYRWRAATIGYYHNTRCVAVAFSVWTRQTVVLLPDFHLLRKKTLLALLPQIQIIFFALWKQTINVRILGEHRLFQRAKWCLHLWHVTTYYLRKSRASHNLFEISLPMKLLQLQIAELKMARSLVQDQWRRVRRMSRYAHVLNSHVMQILSTTSRLNTPQSSLSSMPSTPRHHHHHHDIDHTSPSSAHASTHSSTGVIRASNLLAHSSSTMITLSGASEYESMVEVITPAASAQNTPRDISNEGNQIAFSNLFPTFPEVPLCDKEDATNCSSKMHEMMQLSHVMLAWRDEVLQRRIAHEIPSILLYLVKRQEMTRIRTAMFAWQRAAPTYTSLPDFRAREHARFRRCISTLCAHTQAWYGMIWQKTRTNHMVTRKACAIFGRVIRQFICRWNDAVAQQIRCRRAYSKCIRGSNLRVRCRVFDALSKQVRLARIRRKIAGSVRSRELFGAFVTWLKTASASARLRRLRIKLARRRTQSRCYASFGIWRYSTKERAETANVIGRVVSRWLKKSLGRALMTLALYGNQRRAQKCVEKKIVSRLAIRMASLALLCLKEHVLRFQMVGKAAFRLTKRIVLAALTTWRNVVNIRQRKIYITRRVSRLWVSGILWKTWTMWKDRIGKQLSLRRILSKVVSKQLKLCILLRFEGWKRKRKYMTKHKRILSSIVMMWTSQHIKAALCIWADHVCDKTISLI